MKTSSKRRLSVCDRHGLWLLAAAAATGARRSPAKDGRPGARGSARSSGLLLPRDHLTEESAIQVDLSKESVRLPLYKGVAYKGTPKEEKVWYVLLDASDQGIAHDLGVNYAPKLGNLAIGDPEAVQTVTLESPTPDQNKFGQAVVDFQGAPGLQPDPDRRAGPDRLPARELPARRRRRAGLQPVHPDRRLADRLQRADRRDRRRAVRRRPSHEHRRPRARRPHRRRRRRPASSRSRGSTCCS